MSRKKLFIRGLGVGYLAMGANIAYSLISIPLAIHYLGKEQFGLWAVVLQIVGYIGMLDFGMASGIARILIDEKDNRADGNYGSVLLTGSIVQGIVGAAIAIVGWLGAPLAAKLMAIPAPLVRDFILLVGIQATIAGIGVALRMLGSSLYVYQRQDIVGYSHIGLFLVYLLGLWIGLCFGWGLYAMVFSSALGLVWGVGFSGAMVHFLGLFPRRGEWGRPSMQRFKGIFAYSRNTFLMGVGWQLLNGSPVMVISRTLGLDAAAAWSVCYKPFQILLQFLSRPTENIFPVASEMYARGEFPNLIRRVRHLSQLTAALAIAGGVSLAVINPAFIHLWTSGKIEWPILNHASLALLMMVYSVMRIFNGFVGITKKFGALTYLYFLEGLIFVGLSLLGVTRFGIAAVPLSAVLCHLLISSPVGLRYFASSLGLRYGEMGHWFNRSLLGFLITATAGVLVYWVTYSMPSPTALLWELILMGCISGVVLLHVSIPSEIRAELFLTLNKLYAKNVEKIP